MEIMRVLEVNAMKKRLLAVIAAALLLAQLGGASAANTEYVVMPNMVADFANIFNAKAQALGFRYSSLYFTRVNYVSNSSAFRLRGPDDLAYAYSDTMKLTLTGEHDSRRITSFTITATPLEREYASSAAYRQEWTSAALIALESLVTGVTRAEASRVLSTLSMPIDTNITGAALGQYYGYLYYPGYSYAYPTAQTDKGASVSETLNNFPLQLTAEIESSGKFTMTAQLAGVYPYPMSSLSIYSHQNPWTLTPTQTQTTAITLSPGVTADVRVGGAFVIRLDYTQGDGYEWAYSTEGDAAPWLESDQRYTTLVQPNVTHGVREWRFIATQYGSATLTFLYKNDSDQSVAQAARFFINAY